MKTLGAITLVIISLLLQGFAFNTLFGWYITAPYGLPAPGIVASIGIMLIIGLSTGKRAKKSKNSDDFVAAMVQITARPVVALALGWILHFFMV